MLIPYGGEMDFTYVPCWFRIYQKVHLRVKSITEGLEENLENEMV